MNCPGENTLLDLLQERTGATADEALQAHLESCETCGLLLAEARGDRSRTDSDPRPVDPDATRGERNSARRRRRPQLGPDPLIGQRIGEYEVLERVGAGGMGVVYRAVQPLIGKPVAIKVIRATPNDDAKSMQRMLLEARAVNAIGHRGIVDIFGFGQLPGGRHYVVMEYLQGQPLDVWLRSREPLSLMELLAVLDELLGPLGAAHQAGVVHRDLKPSNLFRVQHQDGTWALKLLDFGLAKQTLQDRSLTGAGLVVGTPAYMAPEQVLGETVDARTDLYSLAVVAYRLAGTRPFAVTDPVSQMQAHLHTAPQPLREQRPDLPEALEALLLRMLQKDPEQRPGSVEEVRRELLRLRPLPVTLEAMPSQGSRRRWPLAAAGGAAGLSVLVAAALLRVGPGAEVTPAPPPTPLAEPAVPTPPSTAAVQPFPEPAAIPGPEPVDEPIAVPALKVARAVARVAPPTLEEERNRLLARVAAARARLGDPDPLSSMFLDKGEQDARQAGTRAQLRQAERTIKAVEEKFLSSGR